jgi:hypothetical protein
LRPSEVRRATSHPRFPCTKIAASLAVCRALSSARCAYSRWAFAQRSISFIYVGSLSVRARPRMRWSNTGLASAVPGRDGPSCFSPFYNCLR